MAQPWPKVLEEQLCKERPIDHRPLRNRGAMSLLKFPSLSPLHFLHFRLAPFAVLSRDST